MFSRSSNFLEVYTSATNDFRVRKKRGKQQYFKQHKQIRYHNIFSIINILTLLSADAKSDILVRVPSLTKAEVRNFPLIHFPRWFCLVNGQLFMSLQRVKRSVIRKIQCFCLFDIQQWSVLSQVLLSPSQKSPLNPSLKRFSKVSVATSTLSFFTKMLKPLQFVIFVALGGTSQSLPKNIPYWLQ